MSRDMSVHFSSESNEWATPQDFYDKYDDIYNFVFDLACTSENCKAPTGYMVDRDINSLEMPWHTILGWSWLNPPYGRELKKWVKKAYEESLLGAKIVMLIPSRTDTSYWHDYIFDKAKIEFIRGRLKFGDSKNSAPFPSAVVIYGEEE